MSYESVNIFESSSEEFSIDKQLHVSGFQNSDAVNTYKNSAFRESYFTFVLIKKGRNVYMLDENKYVATDHMIYFTNPGHLKTIRPNKGIDGRIISFSEKYLKKYIDNVPYESFSFLLKEQVPPLLLDNDLFKILWSIVTRIEKETHLEYDKKDVLLASYFKIFLLKVKEKFFMVDTLLEEGDSQSEIVRQFKIDLENYMREIIKSEDFELLGVQDFADKQSLDLGYFTTVIKYKTGTEASDWVGNKIIQLAQGMLMQTNETIQGVAQKLGYEDIHSFTQHFKKHTGYTPGIYRKTHN